MGKNMTKDGNNRLKEYQKNYQGEEKINITLTYIVKK